MSVHVWEPPHEKRIAEALDKIENAKEHAELLLLARTLADRMMSGKPAPNIEHLSLPWWAGICCDEKGDLCVVNMRTWEMVSFGKKQ